MIEIVVNDAGIEEIARAMNLEAGRQRGLTFEDDWHTLTEQERGGWRLVARAGIEGLSATLRTSSAPDMPNISPGQRGSENG